MKKKVGIAMEKISTLLYSMKQGIKNIYRNRLFSLATIGTIMACLFLFGIFYFVLSNFQYMIKSAETSVGITVFFDGGIKEEQIQTIGDTIKKRAEVDRINYISAEEAWEKFQADVFDGDEELAKVFLDDNPLADSASYEIYLNDISMQTQLVNYIKGLEGVRQVNSSDATAKGLSSFNTLVGYISAAIIIILLAVSIFLISTTVTMGITVRKDEIRIMRLIGATDFFIRAPFIVEGVAIGLIGAILPLLALFVTYDRVVKFVADKFQVLSGILTFLDAQVVFATLTPLLILLGVGIGFVGSFLTVRKHLHV